MRAEWLFARAVLRSFRQQPSQPLLLMLGICLGIAVVTAVQLSTGSARLSYQAALEKFTSGVTHRITAPEGVPQQLYRQLRTAPQQWDVWPVVQQPVTLVSGQRLTLYGFDLLIDRRLQEDAQGLGAEVSLDATVLSRAGGWLHRDTLSQLLPDGGDQLTLVTPAGKQDVQVFGSLVDPFNRQWLVMDIGQALELTGTSDRLSYLDLKLIEGQEAALRSLLPDGVQLKALSVPSVPVLGDALYFNLNAMALLALVMGGLVVFSTVSLSLRQRQSLFASWRLSGVSGVQLGRWLVLELLLLSMFATLAGLLLGIWLAQQLLPLLVASQAAFAAPPVAHIELGTMQLLSITIAGPAATMMAAAVPVRRLTMSSPLALQQALPMSIVNISGRKGMRFSWLSLLILSVATGLTSLESLWALYGAVALFSVLALLWCSPLLTVLSTGLSWLISGRPLVLMVVRDGLRQQIYSIGVMLVLLLTLSSAIAIAGMTTSFHSAFQQWIGQRINADLYISGADSLEALADQLQQRTDVAALDRRWRSSVMLSGRSVGVYAGLYPSAARSAYHFQAGDTSTLWQRLQDEPVALISEPLAYHLGLNVGDRISLAEQQPPLEIVGIYYDYGSYQGQILLGQQSFAALFPAQQPYGLRLWLSADGDVKYLRQLPLLQDAELLEAQPILQRSERLFEQTFLITDLLQLLLLVVALVAMATNLLAMQLARRPELKRYRALGMPPAIQGSLLLGQALMLALCAGLLALPLGELLAWLLTERVQKVAFGWSIPWQYEFSRSVTALLAGMLVALLAALYPAFGQEVSDED